ncbi:putative C-myc promoter-binding protein [Apostichopus japonicus]|uniref:Putative C-myc promoter-binding protein n=1 Tax=Stichopus japonicus TaxID=307972 RepID=A0A2G8KSX5_STIJA|nr:putative C-myc promoter-binding protein [Apostichopus japonicus]
MAIKTVVRIDSLDSLTITELEVESRFTMDDHGPRVADYFVLTGLTEDSKPLDEEIQSEGHIKPQRNLAPITDIIIIIKSQGEKVPPGYTCIDQTPFGFQADLNNGCLGSPSIFLCYKRGYDTPPLTDIGILYEGKSRLMEGCEVVSSTPTGLQANVNSRIGVSSQRAYITFRKAKADSPHNTLAVIDITVILTNKGETPPHAFNLINKNLNKGSMVGNDVYICYKKSAILGNSLVYEPALLSRYPLEDYPEFSLPDSVSKFCMPLGATIECWPKGHTHPLPLFSTFVLTDQGGAKVYGAGVTFYESYPENNLTDQQRESFHMKESQSYSIHTNKCICILSRWPFFDAFKKFLTFIYRLSLSGPLTVPIERYIAHFMHEVPFPTPQRPRIFMQLGHSSLVLAQPQTSPLPLSGASYCALLQNLGPETCLNLLTYVLLENKILLHSLRPALLTAVAEAVSSMIFPFVWQCPYVPLCPLFLAMTLNAPFPVIFGIDSRYFDKYDPPTDATCVDIDTNTILLPDDKKGMSWKILPKKPAKKLLSMLASLHREVLRTGIGDSVSDDLAIEMAPLDDDFNKKRNQIILELKIQDAFLIFMASIMKDYNKYLLPITQQPTQRVTDADARFDCSGFIKSRDRASHGFFKQLSKTQQFIKLVEDVSFVSENDERVAFFEECTERVDPEGKEDVKLIDYEAVRDSEHTVFVTPPDETELEGMEFDYKGFPVLNPSLFLPMGQEGNIANRSTRNVFNSPFPRRTKQEMRQSQKMAKSQASSPEQWANYLLSQCYALWFLHLPSYVQGTHSKTRALKASFEVLKKIQGKNLHLVDEVCYRILMQLCGQYSQPVLAVQVFMEMRQRDVKINAITYGYYNKAVLESRWPASSFSGYQQWVKLRHTLLAVAQFKRSQKRRSYSDNSDVVSRSSGDSVEADGRVEEASANPCTMTREEKSSTGMNDL